MTQKELIMDNNCTYRYIVLYDNEKNIIYGECIKWLIGEFDREIEFTRRENLGEGLKLLFISSKTLLHTIDYEQGELCIQGKLLKFKVHANDFIALRYDQPFNPLSDRCSKVEIFAKDEIIDFDARIWIRNSALPFKKLKEITNIDVTTNSDLLNTFIFYEPTRIIVDSRFLDKRKNISSAEPKNLQIIFKDEFNHFENAKHLIKAFKDSNLLDSKSGGIGEIVNLNLAESPDELEIKIFDKDENLIYEQRYFYIKKIVVGATIESGTVELENGDPVAKYSTEHFSVGE
jgi:hypothetical protein